MMLEGMLLTFFGLLLFVWSLTVTVANLQPSPELTGLDLIDSESTVELRTRPEEIEPRDVTLMHVDPTRRN